MAGGAIHGAMTAKPGERLAGAVKGAWDMSLPGMVVNTAKDVSQAISDRHALDSQPRVSNLAGLHSFEKAAAGYKARAAAAQTSDGEHKPKGWRNPIVQAKAQAAKGRTFSGVYKDGSN